MVRFSDSTKKLALQRQQFLCASCAEQIYGQDRLQNQFGEQIHAHHIRHVKFGGTGHLDNCVIICQACHYLAHEGGNYRNGTVIGTREDFPYFNGSA